MFEGQGNAFGRRTERLCPLVTSDDIPHLLVVDDDADFARLLERMLQNGGYEVLCVASGEAALERLAHTRVDLVLLDVRMPGLDGFETCRQIKARPTTANLPVIFMTGEARSPELFAQALSAGGADYLTKPLSRVDVLSRVRYLLQQRMEYLWLKRLDAEDKVTGLPGRNYFKAQLEEALSECSRFYTPVSLVLAQLEGFEAGHGGGPAEANEVCVTRFAALFRSESRRPDVVARLSVSRFGLLLPRVGLLGAEMAAQRLSDIWRSAPLWAEQNEPPRRAIFATEGHDGTPPPPSSGDLLKRAETALEEVVPPGTTLMTPPIAQERQALLAVSGAPLLPLTPLSH